MFWFSIRDANVIKQINIEEVAVITKKSLMIVITMAIGIFLCMLDTTVMNIALPAIQTSLGVNLSRLSWALNGYTIVFAVFTVPLGQVGDRYGRNKFYVLGLIIFLIGSLSSGLAGSVNGLIAGRLVQSFGAAIVFPASMLIGINAVSVQHRTIAISILGTTQGLASALGPSIGGIITSYVGWRWVFLLNVPIVMVVIGLSIWLLNYRSEPQLATKVDGGGIIISALMLFALTYSLINASDWGWLSAKTIGLLMVAGLLLAGFVLYESRVSTPMVPMKLFTNLQFSGAAIIMTLSTFFLVGFSVIMPTLFTHIQGKTELQAALMITPMSVMIFIAAPISGFLLAKVGPRLLALLGLGLMGAAYTLISVMDMNSYGQMLLVCILLGTGFGIIAGPITVIGAADFTGSLLTASQSVLGVIRQIGSLLAVAIFVSLLTTGLNQASKSATVEATSQIAAARIPRGAKLEFNRQVAEKLNSNDKTHSASGTHSEISKQRIRQIVQLKEREALQRLPKDMAQRDKNRVKDKVSNEVRLQMNGYNREIKRLKTRVLHIIKTKLTAAFTAPYQICLPIIWVSLVVVFMLKSRRKYSL